MQKVIEKNGQDTIYLIQCVLSGQTPDEDRILNMDLPWIFRYSYSQTMSALIYRAVEPLMNTILADSRYESDKIAGLMKSWKELSDMALRKEIMLDDMREKLFAYLEEKHIWYMPLKGVLLKELYPAPGLRQMADNDILFDNMYQEEVKQFFLNQGFEVKGYGKGNHDEYEMEPIYNFEMHRSLFCSVHDKEWQNYYSNVKERLIKNDNCSYGYHFTDEDFYIYFITHACKHLENGGTGLRTFTDCYLYQKSKNLNWAYIEEELDKMGLKEVEGVLRSVSSKVFEKGASVDILNEKEYDLLSGNMYVGTYGTIEGSVDHKLKKMSKGKYLFRRFFPEESMIKEYYPFVYRHKILYPFFIIYRIIKGLIVHSGKLWNEFKCVLKNKNK